MAFSLSSGPVEGRRVASLRSMPVFCAALQRASTSSTLFTSPDNQRDNWSPSWAVSTPNFSLAIALMVCCIADASSRAREAIVMPRADWRKLGEPPVASWSSRMNRAYVMPSVPRMSSIFFRTAAALFSGTFVAVRIWGWGKNIRSREWTRDSMYEPCSPFSNLIFPFSSRARLLSMNLRPSWKMPSPIVFVMVYP